MQRLCALRKAVLCALVCLALPSVAAAQTQVAVNGQAPPASVTIAAGATVSIAVSQGPGSTTDWVALSVADAPEGSYVDWRYLNGATTPPSGGLTDATLTFTMPVVAGTYEFRFYANNAYTRLATSTIVTVVTSPSVLTVNGINPPTAASVAAGSVVTLDVSGGPANATDWVALYPVGAADTAYLTWRFLNGATSSRPRGWRAPR